jgi:cytochrome c
MLWARYKVFTVAMAGFAVTMCVSMTAGEGAALAQSGAAAQNGVKLFAQCAACHGLTPGGRSGVGPNLHGIFGKKAGTIAPGYPYSAAMRESKIIWTDDTMNRFLAAPRTVIPGTKMVYRGMPNPADRAALIAHLKSSAKGKK